MKLFVCYARVDRPYCVQIVNTLEVHEIWYDRRLYAGQYWWKEILRRLDWCDALVYLLSPESLNSEYCQKEYQLAKSLGRPIIPVLIDSNLTLPPEFTDMQYADFSGGMTSESVTILLNSIYVAEMRKNEEHAHQLSVSNISPEAIQPPMLDPAKAISIAANAMGEGQYDKAYFILKQAKANGQVTEYIDIDALLKEAELALERQSYLREAERGYRQIAALINVEHTRPLGCKAFGRFRKAYPDYDPDKLLEVCVGPAPAQAPTGSGSQFTFENPPPALTQAPPTSTIMAPPQTQQDTEAAPASNGAADQQAAPSEPDEPETLPETPIQPETLPPDFTMKLLEWCNIEAGDALISENGKPNSPEIAVQVAAFSVSKYPITNEQYQMFLDADDGYVSHAWWEFSPHAMEWRAENPEPRASQFKGAERPREMVNWYDAMAFCRWLSTKLGFTVTLPNVNQWVRVARGDQQTVYPWGTDFLKENCNTSESKIKMTTPVTRYPEGKSSFSGAVDLCGNCWEWCLNPRDNTDESPEVASDDDRAVHGGSYLGPANRAKISFRYYLKPKLFYSTISFRIVKLP